MPREREFPDPLTSRTLGPAEVRRQANNVRSYDAMVAQAEAAAEKAADWLGAKYAYAKALGWKSEGRQF